MLNKAGAGAAEIPSRRLCYCRFDTIWSYKASFPSRYLVFNIAYDVVSWFCVNIRHGLARRRHDEQTFFSTQNMSRYKLDLVEKNLQQSGENGTEGTERCVIVNVRDERTLGRPPSTPHCERLWGSAPRTEP